MPEPTEHQLKAASKVIHKWMRKGNMSRALQHRHQFKDAKYTEFGIAI